MGPYRHVLERRGDFILDAAMAAWTPYVKEILRALDLLPADEEIERALLVRLKLWLIVEFIAAEIRPDVFVGGTQMFLLFLDHTRRASMMSRFLPGLYFAWSKS